MERYFQIAKVNLKCNLLMHGLICLIVLMLMPLIVSVKNLDAVKTAKLIELYLSLIGLVLFVPIFLPDEDRNIRDLVQSKKINVILIHIIRILEALVLLIILSFGFLIFLKRINCIFPFCSYLYGMLSDCIFVGGLGVLVYALSDNLPTAYMVPLLYYILCFSSGKKYFGKLYLFSMKNGSIVDKKYLMFIGLLMIILGIIFRNINYSIYFYRRKFQKALGN